MLATHIDHLVIAATSLDQGAAYVSETLGVSLQAGGQHPRMGTHNRVLKLGERSYLEVIAIDPNLANPGRPRWFGLDRLESSKPARLATWVARTNAIHAAADASPIALGEIEAMSRGDMNWLITIPPDGSLPLHGIAPALIQWPEGVHPASKLPESGCQLQRLVGFHPEAGKIANMLEAVGFIGSFEPNDLEPGRKPYLVAYIQTPNGVRELGI